MLVRTASNLYWMSRYIERASCLSQLLIVQMTEMPEDSVDFVLASWKKFFDRFSVSGFKNFSSSEFKEEKTSERFLLANAYTFVDYFTFETYHGGSILSCLGFARENARQSQEKITRLMWPHINKTYLQAKDMQLKDLWPYKIIDFYRDILKFSYLSYGMARDLLCQDELAHFIQIGRFLERFQNTASFLRSIFVQRQVKK